LQETIAIVVDQAKSATTAADEAVDVAARTRQVIAHLGESSDEIEEVVDLICSDQYRSALGFGISRRTESLDGRNCSRRGRRGLDKRCYFNGHHGGGRRIRPDIDERGADSSGGDLLTSAAVGWSDRAKRSPRKPRSSPTSRTS